MNLEVEIDHLWVRKKQSYLVCKRGIDIVGSLVGIILFLPIFVIIGLCIKIEDGNGPIFYTQNRVGKHNQLFKIYKFRTMIVNADQKLTDVYRFNENKDNLMFKMKNDPRVTRTGTFIRKFSLDEFPQLINVLKGEMSLVGPRPPLVNEVDKYSAFDIQRLLVKPGCTGLWQVTGRNSIPFKEMVKLDLFYIQKESIFYDFILILKTFVVLVFPNEVY